MDPTDTSRTSPAEPRDTKWTVLSEAFVLSSTPRILFLGLLSVAVAAAGASLVPKPRGEDRPESLLFTLTSEPGHDLTWPLSGPITDRAVAAFEPILLPTRLALLTARGSRTGVDFAWNLASLLWHVAIGGLFGIAIARTALEQFCLDRRVSMPKALLVGFRRLPASFAAVAAPSILVALLLSPIKIGILFGLTLDSSGFVALMLVPLLSAALATYVFVKTLASWPAMVVTASLGEDAIEALSRSFSYTASRGIGVVLLFAGWMVSSLTGTVLAGLVAWTAGRLVGPPIGNGAAFIKVASPLVLAWSHAFFWCWWSMAYLLLRREVDGESTRFLNLPAPPLPAIVEPTEPPAEPSND